ncbi:MAG: hypothetical protein FJ202_00430 [Gemmatimonadetes bacterium]|nr:hypothetical protein [Gemmatimonadota bacterium]
MQKAYHTFGATVALVGAALAAACGDVSKPLGPTEPNPTTPSRIGERANTLNTSGTARVVVRRLDAGPFGRVLESEAGTYSAAVTSGGAVEGSIQLRSGSIDVGVLAVPSKARRRGSWNRELGRLADGGSASVKVSAADGAPVGEIELRRGGTVIGRIAKSWELHQGSWRLVSMTQTAYSAGVPTVSITISFDEHRRWTSTSPSTESKDVVSMAPVDQASYGEDESGPCESEYWAFRAAIDEFHISNLGYLACLAGPIGCLAASLNAIRAGFAVDRAEERLLACLRAT